MIAVLLKVGSGIQLIKPAKLYMCTQTHYKHNKDGRMASGVCGHGSIPLNHLGNVVTRIGLHTESSALLLATLLSIQPISLLQAFSRDCMKIRATYVIILSKLYKFCKLYIIKDDGFHFFYAL